MNEILNKNFYDTLVYEFTNEAFVVCPNCDKKAIVKSEKIYDEIPKLVCVNCGYNKVPDNTSTNSSKTNKSKNTIKKIVVIGNGIDPYFYLPLWLSINVGENLLWAYNYKHLNFIKNLVSAKL